MKLTAKQVQAARYRDRAEKLFDGHGLYLHITRTARTWRYTYRIDGKAKEFTIGPLDVIPLVEARARHKQAQALVIDGIDPVVSRKNERLSKQAAELKAERDALPFEHFKDEWLARKTWAESNRKKIELRLSKYLPTSFVTKPVSTITADDVMALLDPIQKGGKIDLAYRLRTYLKAIFDRAIVKKCITANPVVNPTVELLDKPKQVKLAHTTDPKIVAAILRGIDVYIGDRSVQNALRLHPLVFTRPTELRETTWAEINFDQALWSIPKERMKSGREHKVPLSMQALAILREQKDYYPDTKMVFPSPRNSNKAISSGTLNMGLRRLGFPQDIITSHGFRHIASTFLHDFAFDVDGKSVRFRHEAIELQLAHWQKTVSNTYNSAEHLDERTTMMQAWADYLDQIKGEDA